MILASLAESRGSGRSAGSVMRRWWIGAVCLAASASLHAQGSVQQTNPETPTASPAQTGAPNAPLPLSATPPPAAAAPAPGTEPPAANGPAESSSEAAPSPAAQSQEGSLPSGDAGASSSNAPAGARANELSAPAAPVTQAPPASIPVGNAPRQRARRAARPGPSTPSPITDHFALRAIYFLGDVSTHAQFNPATGPAGTPFSAEQILGLSNRTSQAQAELMFRLEQRGRLRLNFLDLRRSGDAKISAPLQYGSQLFNAGSVLQSEVDWRQTDFTYTYSFLRTDRFELGLGAAVHLIQAEATAQVPNTPQRAVYSEAGPFVTIAADGTVRIDRHWSLNARGQYLKLTINNNNGELAIYHADIQYRWRDNFAIGLGYEREHVDVDLLHTNPSGYVQLNINGPELFARLSF